MIFYFFLPHLINYISGMSEDYQSYLFQEFANVVAESDHAGLFFTRVKDYYWELPEALGEQIMVNLKEADKTKHLEIIQDARPL